MRRDGNEDADDGSRRGVSAWIGGPSPATMAERSVHAKKFKKSPYLTFGLLVAAVVCAADQASKLYLLFGYDLPARPPIRLGPFFDFVFVRNFGISYGLLPMQGRLGALLLLGFKVVAVAALIFWLTRVRDRFTALSLALIIGGAVGNAIDRAAYGWVFDFIFFHIRTATWRFDWYVFNLADAAIVAGVIGLLYDSLRGDGAAKAP
jgi:signal peptidase II